MTASLNKPTTWIDDMREFLTLGLQHDPVATKTLVKFASIRGVHCTLDEQVERLPANCRGRARRIVRDARLAGATDERICRILILTHAKLLTDLLVQK